MRARDNPFASDRVLRIRYQPLDDSLPELLERLEQLTWRAAITGSEGTGKTTLLEALQILLHERGYVTLLVSFNRERRRLPLWLIRWILHGPAASTVLLLDGAEQLDPITWQWLRWSSREAHGLIITSHREGMLPTLVRCSTTPDLLRTIVAEIAGPDAVSPGMIHTLFKQHQGSLREALRELYNVYATGGSKAAGLAPEPAGRGSGERE